MKKPDGAKVVTLLLGSGVSCGADLLGTADLTPLVLASDNPDEAAFLAALRLQADELYGSGRSNYEDVYSLAAQVFEHLSANHDNPALGPFVHELASKLGVRLEALQRLADTGIRRIAEKLTGQLAGRPKFPCYQGLIEAFAACRAVPHVFTLNHDLLFELYVGSRLDDDWVTGFAPVSGQPRHWNPALDESPARRRFIKLHGSIDWWRTRPTADQIKVSPTEVFGNGEAGTPPSPAIQRDPFANERITKGSTPSDLERMDGHPLILAGTLNKLFDYSRPIFLWMHGRFLDSLQRSTRLIVCGYGFGDKGVNNQVADWIYGGAGRRMVVVDPRPFASARPAIQAKVGLWQDHGRLTVIRKSFGPGSDLSWGEIASAAMQP